MRRLIKQQISEIIQSVYEAIELCKKNPDINILADCQNAAVTIGEHVEESEGIGTDAVSFLEMFADSIYNAGLSIDNPKKFAAALVEAADRLSQAEYEIKNKIPVSYEILFMPYKSSMWDSFDSVYREAVQCSDCNVTVMPVPYFILDSNQDILRIEYEGEEFPEDISITRYDNYSIPVMHPDVIFIHYPYDEFNRITRMPNCYFSSEIVKHTEHLVYIPYFVNDGSSIAEHYCTKPAVRYAWRVFVHSEKVRRTYCNFVSPEKVIALGSPKFDMVVSYENNKSELSLEWKEKCSGRTVYLYNTHINTIMNHAEKTIEQMNYIFSVFEKRNDIVLLWRPHPLSIQSAESMNPAILDKYMQVIERFKLIPNGIYDDTADVHRAIAISDAYIGNWSSLVSMYSITGKPIYLIDKSGITADDIFCFVSALAGIVKDGVHYVYSNIHNMLMRIENGTAYEEAVFDIPDKTAYEKVSGIYEYGDNLVIAPMVSNRIIFYNPKTKNTEYYDIADGLYTTVYGIVNYILIGENLYIITPKLTIIKFSLKKRNAEYYRDLIVPETDDVVFLGAYRDGDNIIITCRNSNKILIWNTITEKYTVQIVPCEDNFGLLSPMADEKYIYFLTFHKRNIIRWDKQTHRAELFFMADDIMAEKIYLYKNKLFMLPQFDDNIAFIDIDTKEFNKIEYPEKFRYLHNYTPARYLTYQINKNIMSLYPRSSNMYLELNMDTNTFSGYEWRAEEKISTEAKMKNFIYSSYIYYSNKYKLTDFIDMMPHDKYKEERKNELCRNIVNPDGSAGKKIWEHIKSALDCG